jgi:hypothetical protein
MNLRVNIKTREVKMKKFDSKQVKQKAITAAIVIAGVSILIYLFLLPAIIFLENNEIHDYEIKYDENFIIGNDYRRVVDEYGEFDITYGEFGKGTARGGYSVKYDYINGGDRFYFIVFNSEMIATKTYIAKQPGG